VWFCCATTPRRCCSCADNKPGLNAAGLWVFPAVNCEPGESLEAGARREFREETGYECGELRWVTTILHPSDDGRLMYGSSVRLPLRRFSAVHCFEGQAVEFIPRAEAGSHPMPEYVPAVWDMAIEMFARPGAAGTEREQNIQHRTSISNSQ